MASALDNAVSACGLTGACAENVRATSKSVKDIEKVMGEDKIDMAKAEKLYQVFVGNFKKM